MNELMQRWLDCKRVEQAMKEQREEIEAQIYLAIQDQLPQDGQKKFDYGDLSLTVKQNFSVKVDQDKAKDFPDLFKWKAEMSYSQFKKSNQVGLEDMVTVSMSKPTFTVGVKDA